MNFFAFTRPAFMPRLAAAAPWTWAPERRRRVARSWLRGTAIALAALLLLWGLLWLAVPPLLKSQAQQRLSALLGRTVTIGAVQFAPWSLQLTLHELTVAGPAGAATPLLQVQRIHADADWRSLIRLAPVIERFEVDAPQVSLARTASGRYDVDDIIERLKPPPAADSGSKQPARFALYNLQVRDGALSFDDQPAARRHELKGLLLTLPFLSTLPSQVEVAVEPRLAFTFDGTRFDSGAQSTPFARDRETSMTLSMGEFDLTIAKPYLPPDLIVGLQRGRAQADVSLHFELRDDNSASVSLRGVLKLSDIALADRAGAPLAAWRSLQVALTDVQPLESQMTLGNVRVEGLDVALTRDAQGRINVVEMARPPGAAAAASAPLADGAAASAPGGVAQRRAAAKAWQVNVKQLELADARVRWHDAMTQPAAIS